MGRVVKALLLGIALLGGCSYHVRFESRPHGASMALDDGRSFILPADVMLPWRPLARPVATFEAEGYRGLEVRIGPRLVRGLDYVTDLVVNPVEAFGDVPRRVITIHLVPEHGPVGTWRGEDVP